MKTPLIHIENLVKNFEKGPRLVKVLREISLDIYPGDFVIVLGPSGGGKSTLLNCLVGLTKATSGKIIVKGQEITKFSDEELARFRLENFGMIYQREEWVNSLDVIHNVALPLIISGLSWKEALDRAKKTLKVVDMEKYSQFSPRELSGGQEQKVACARALVTDPLIIIADEPTGDLDTEGTERIMEFFKDLNRERKRTILLVTHNPYSIKFGTRTIYIEDGKLKDIEKLDTKALAGLVR